MSFAMLGNGQPEGTPESSGKPWWETILEHVPKVAESWATLHPRQPSAPSVPYRPTFVPQTPITPQFIQREEKAGFNMAMLIIPAVLGVAVIGFILLSRK